MCLKYFIAYPSCDHHEYLGSHHCRTTPCDLAEQHFHYIEDNFPISNCLELEAKRGALACEACTAKHRDKLDPDEAPVQYYPPANNVSAKELSPTGYSLHTNSVKDEPGGVGKEEETEDCDYDYDYKSLSNADEDEWNILEEQGKVAHIDIAHDDIMAQMHRDYVQNQLKGLPNYLAQQRQNPPFVPPGFTAETCAMGAYLHYPMPLVSYVPMPSLPQWYGGIPALASVHMAPIPGAPTAMQVIPPLAQEDVVVPTTPAVVPQRPDTPPTTPPMQHPLLPRPPAPFIVGTITDAYLRVEAAKREHMRERARRRQSSLRDSLPARSMALTDFMVYKRVRKGHHRNVDAADDAQLETWSNLPFAGEESDTEGGAEEYAGIAGTEKATCRFSCRLVTLM